LSNEHFLGSKLLAIAPREILDALVIFSVPSFRTTWP